MERALPPPAAASASTPTASTTTPPLPLDASSERVKEDILRIVVQYLQGEGYTSSVMTIQDEANVKAKEKLGKRAMMKRMRKSILDGDWPEAEKLCQRSSLRSQKSFLYAIHKQQYLELIDQQEYQKAFTLLARRLKPLEAMQTRGEEFKDLCYLLTCKSIQDVPSCRDWEGVAAAREKLVDQFQSLFEFDESESDGYVSVPPNRLVRLLQQAVAHQISQNHYQPRAPPRIGTLLEDYRCFVLPNSVRHTFSGHRSNVKCVAFVGDAGERIATGSSDNTVRLWDTDSGRHLSTLAGHSSRVWDVSSNGAGTLLASAVLGVGMLLRRSAARAARRVARRGEADAARFARVWEGQLLHARESLASLAGAWGELQARARARARAQGQEQGQAPALRRQESAPDFHGLLLQAVALNDVFGAKMHALAAATGGMFRGCATKDDRRSVQKVQRCLGGDWRRLCDVVRCRLVFATVAGVEAVLRAIAADAELEVVVADGDDDDGDGDDAQMRLRESYDAAALSSGYRDVRLCCRLNSTEARRRGVHGHVAEVQIHLGALLALQTDESHANCIKQRNLQVHLRPPSKNRRRPPE